ncbi:MAG: SGNH/GDSL hydrolase family protein [Bacteroidota bacterium]|nr:SGNH/GDSL hydrolase family protein [Bacteroidota bacterium]
MFIKSQTKTRLSLFVKKIFRPISLRILLCNLLLCSVTHLTAQKNDGIDTALIPFWKTTTMYNESVLMISENGGLPAAKLLFKTDKILSVRNSALNTDYKEGVDWEYKHGQLLLPKGSKAAYLTDEQLYPDTSANTFPKKGGGLILFHEGSFFHSHQLAVTYTHAPDQWKGPVTVFQGGELPEVMDKLKRRISLKMLLFGDSIAAGYNASGETDSPPHLPSWGNLVAEGLRRYYKENIAFTNTSVAGKDSQWGLATVQERVIAHDPDLVIIAFGMNDGTGRMDPKLFKANIQGIISAVKQHNPKSEFILVVSMMPNPESNFLGTQELFEKVLAELTGPGVVLVDMDSVHTELLKYKSYQDMTGNNINHPNDFLIRWYAQEILASLIPY